jgi:hypothetical protein
MFISSFRSNDNVLETSTTTTPNTKIVEMSDANNAGAVELNATPTGAINNNNLATPESTGQRPEITELDETEARTSQHESDLYEDEDITNYHNALYRLEAGPDAMLPVPRRSNLALEHLENVNVSRGIHNSDTKCAG